jgi:hypothetical protein
VSGLLSIQLTPTPSVRSGVEVTNCLAGQICLTVTLFAKKDGEWRGGKMTCSNFRVHSQSMVKTQCVQIMK